jgi:broad specificity phosphatase PhoE
MKRVLLLTGLSVLGNIAAPCAGPADAETAGGLSNAVILVIRHAEKPANGVGLTDVGQARAEACASYFKNISLDGKPLKLDCLIAAADTPGSHRPRLTLEPTSRMLGVPINSTFADLQFQELADELRTRPHGDHILICWHHSTIPALVEALGADPGRLFPNGEWPDDIYNWVVELRYDANGRLVAARRLNEPF